ncbi:MAG: hypothetical protein ACRD2W_10445 [Acidimicrobiales bacterium]
MARPLACTTSATLSGSWHIVTHGRRNGPDVGPIERGKRVHVALEDGLYQRRVTHVREHPTSVRDVTPAPCHPALKSVEIGDLVAIYGMRTGGSPASFEQGDFTVIYVREFARPRARLMFLRERRPRHYN